MTQADYIIAKLGGSAALGRAIGMSQPAVWSWKRRGFVPAKHHSTIMEAAKRLGVPLTAEEFFNFGGVDHRGVKSNGK